LLAIAEDLVLLTMGKIIDDIYSDPLQCQTTARGAENRAHLGRHSLGQCHILAGQLGQRESVEFELGRIDHESLAAVLSVTYS